MDSESEARQEDLQAQPAADNDAGDTAHTEAQRASDGLKSQIAALRARVRDAQAVLRDSQMADPDPSGRSRGEQPRSFKR